jgi:alkaline phosphatase
MRKSLRRSATAVALSVFAVGGGAVVAGATETPDANGGGDEGAAKNIILLIGDGMGTTHVDAARLRYYGAEGKLNMERLPYLGSVSTYAVEPESRKPDYVTDSASSATAWSSGVKTYNAALGKDAFKRVVPTLMEQAKGAGMRTGNVSTAEITDATPAGMFSHVSQRACQGPGTTGCTDGDKPIAEQIAENNTADVILGGGLSRFEPADEAKLKGNGYRILGGEGSFGDAATPVQTESTQKVATRQQLNQLRTRKDTKVIGLFNRGNLTVEKYKRQNPGAVQAEEPTLGEMTSKSIDLLSRSQQGKNKGFLLQVEGALIDKRSHANDAAQTLEETRAFDEAVRRAVEFAKNDGNTLVIVTADHECAGFNIISKSSFTNAEAGAPPVNSDAGNPANNSMPARTAAANAKDATRSSGPVNGSGATDSKNFAPATFRTADDPDAVKDGDPEASLWLSYLSGNHTGQNVQLFATGPEGQNFQNSFDNTDIYFKMRNALTALSSEG